MPHEQFKSARWFLGACLIFALPGNAAAQDSPPADKSPAEQATDAANALKAQYEAEKAKYETQEERIKAAQAALPGSGLTNGATAGTNAGTAEANYLASQLINQMASSISGATPTKSICAKPVTIFSGFNAPDLSDYVSFETRRQAILEDMDQAIAKYDHLPPASQEQRNTKGKRGAKGFALGPLTALIPSILSYLNSNDTSQAVAVSTADNMLIASLAGSMASNGCRVRIASVQLNQAATADIAALLKPLVDKRRTIAIDIAKLGDPKGQNDLQKTVASGLAAAAGEYDQFRLDLVGGMGPDGKAVAATLPLANVVKEYSIATTIGDRYALFATIQNASGGLFVRKNLATAFGVNPFAVSAGAVAYYAVVDGSTGDTIVAGTKQLITPYSQITKVK